MTTISEIMGCANATNKRLANDRYLTPQWCVRALAHVEARHWPDILWEPCAGEGDITAVLREHAQVVESDLIPRRHCRRLDFLKTKQKLAVAIVTNPPFSHAIAFIEHAAELGIEYHAWLLKADFMCAQERHELVRKIGYPARGSGV